MSQDTRPVAISKERSKKRKSYSCSSKQRNNNLKIAMPASQEVIESFKHAFFAKKMNYTT